MFVARADRGGLRASAIAVSIFLPCLTAEPALAGARDPIDLFGIPVDFILFAATLLCVAVFHRHTLPVAIVGLAAIVANKVLFGTFDSGAGLAGLRHHLEDEAVSLANLFLLLLGFAILARHFDQSRACETMPAVLPDD